MDILTVAATLAILLSAAGVVLAGLIWVVRSLRQPPSNAVRPSSAVLRDIASIIIVGLGGLLIGSMLVTAGLVA